MLFSGKFLTTIAGIFLLITILRDMVFRFFFIYPQTDHSGKYASCIEENHVYRWLAPVAAGRRGPTDVFFAGNSHVMDGIDPEVFTQATGFTAFNLALYSLPAQNVLALLFKYNNYPRLIFIEFSARYSTYKYLKTVDNMTEKALNAGPLKQFAYTMVDKVHWIFPSLFIPRPYRRIFFRSVQKAVKLLRTGRMSIGRYTPFKLFSSYEWRLEKLTNHRIARRLRSPSKWEIEYQQHLTQLIIDEMPSLCDIDSPAYQASLCETERMLQALLKENVKIVLMRMPLCERLVAYENEYFGRFYLDIEQIAARYSLDYVDLNRQEHIEELGLLEFYSDGQHLLDSSSVGLTKYLARIAAKTLGKKKSGDLHDNAILHSPKRV